jgi:DNA-binding transcriptional MerR regulator/methylmalonyl-CoA mutase cobalamin-binding subunit
MASSLNIAAIARRTGVAPDTLRKWEQRYGVLRPDRTPGGQRRYSERDVARVEWLRDRLREGYRIGEAARILGGGDAQPAAQPEELPELILAALAANDADRLDSLLDQTFGVLPLEQAIVDVVAPLTERLGIAWSEGLIGVAHEHLLTAKVRGRLVRQLADGAGGVRGTAVLACAPGERHDLGLLMLAVLMQADGWEIEYLGADTPAREALALAAAMEVDVVCLSAAQASTAGLLRDELGRNGREGPPLVVGGRAIDREAARSLGATYAGAGLAPGVARLRKFSR